jgi:uncharacterized protein YwgA
MAEGMKSELILTGTRDQALLALVVQEASAVVDGRGGFLGRTAVQKILYFVAKRGVPMGYRFDIHHYGVFCEEILRDAEWLVADGVIIDRSNQGRYSNYASGDAMQELLDLHPEFVTRHRSEVRQVAQALTPLRPETLELISTLDYVYRWNRAKGGIGPWREGVIRRFEDVKPGKFPRAEIEQVYATMVSAGLVEA